MLNLDINYKYYFSSDEKDTILMLHGWGCKGDIFKQHVDNLQDKYNILIVDLYGFGQSIDPKPFFDTYEYAVQIYLLLYRLGLGKVHVLAHSFGGRLALILSSLFDIEITNMVLTGCAGLKVKHSLGYYIRVGLYKLCKRLGLYLDSGSRDYNSANSIMRKVLTRVVNQNLDYLLYRIKSKTMLVWGKMDKETPMYMCSKLHKNITDSSVMLINSGAHFCIFTHTYLCNNKIKEFLEL